MLNKLLDAAACIDLYKFSSHTRYGTREEIGLDATYST